MRGTKSKNVQTIVQLPQTLQARLQQYVNQELPYVQDGFRKGRETREHQHLFDHTESKGIPEKHLLLVH